MPADWQFRKDPSGAVSLMRKDRVFEQRLRSFFQHIYEHSDHYRGVMKRYGLSPAMPPFELLDAMPPTDKETYREVLQWEALAQLNAQPFITDFSSGSTASCVLRFSAPRDELAEQDITEQVFRRAGMRAGDRFVCMEVGVPEIYDFYFRAARAVGAEHTSFLHITSDYGAAVAPLRQLRPTVLLTLPSILVRAWPHIREFWPRGQSPIHTFIHMGEPMAPGFAEEVSDWLGCRICSFYGTTEIGGIAGDCAIRAGSHFEPLLVCPTIDAPNWLDEQTVEGEGLFTTLHFRTQTVVKYRVGDRVRLTTAPCPCGEPGPRLSFLARTHDSFILTGVKFHYDVLLEALRRVVPGLEYLQIHLSDLPEAEGNTLMQLRLPQRATSSADAIRHALEREIFELDTEFRYGFVRFGLEFLPAHAFEARKIKHVVDERAHMNT